MPSNERDSSKSKILESLEHEALRKIGRNIVNFQSIETMIKFLVSRSQIEGPIEDIGKILRDKKQSTYQRSLGLLAKDLFSSVLGQSSPTIQDNDVTSPWISFSFQLETDDAKRAKLESELKKLINSRNELVHHRLTNVRTDSKEDWQELIEYLDNQHEQLLPVYDWLKSLAKSFIESADAVHKTLNTHVKTKS